MADTFTFQTDRDLDERLSTDAPQNRQYSGPWVFCWINSDTLVRTEGQLITDVLDDLGFSRGETASPTPSAAITANRCPAAGKAA